MFKIDGSQTTWLVYADWLEDQGIPAGHIRDFEETVNDWIRCEEIDGVGSTGSNKNRHGWLGHVLFVGGGFDLVGGGGTKVGGQGGGCFAYVAAEKIGAPTVGSIGIRNN